MSLHVHSIAVLQIKTKYQTLLSIINHRLSTAEIQAFKSAIDAQRHPRVLLTWV
jgi:hypothetical protein